MFGYWVKDPERYSIVLFDKEDRAVAIEEKSARPKSNWAVTGIYLKDIPFDRIPLDGCLPGMAGRRHALH